MPCDLRLDMLQLRILRLDVRFGDRQWVVLDQWRQVIQRIGGPDLIRVHGLDQAERRGGHRSAPLEQLLLPPAPWFGPIQGPDQASRVFSDHHTPPNRKALLSRLGRSAPPAREGFRGPGDRATLAVVSMIVPSSMRTDQTPPPVSTFAA